MNNVFELTEEEVNEIMKLNASKESLKTILADRTLPENVQKMAFEKYAQAVNDYELWFAKKQNQLKVFPSDADVWKVDFIDRKLILI